MMDSTMPRRPEDDTNWGGPREGAGKPRKDPNERMQTLGLPVPGAIKERYNDLPEASRKEIREQVVAFLKQILGNEVSIIITLAGERIPLAQYAEREGITRTGAYNRSVWDEAEKIWRERPRNPIGRPPLGPRKKKETE